MAQLNKLFKNNPTDSVLWVDTSEKEGVFLFTFDGEKYFNLFRDYPHELSAEQKIFLIKKTHFGLTFSVIEPRINP